MFKASNEDDFVDNINKSFQELVDQDVYPRIIKLFMIFDRKYLMPIFKRQ